MIDSNSPLTEDDVSRAEIELGLQLPGDLRSFYLKHNGGRPERRLFLRGDEGFLVEYFLPLVTESHKPGGSVISNFEIWQSVGASETLPQAIPIAFDSVGGNLLYSLDSKSRGAIFCTRSDSAPADRIRFLCPSLEEFLDGLQEWS